ncbi:MAG TPA: SurA N-terminal domain-containing protein, partial [Burkholderiaceae bacterium]|nr:SurA N-terminal domain-containing protein [Burkholderiaceae bacterium]
MFDFIRTHQRLMQLILLVLILPSFVLIGVSGYTNYVSGDQELVKVAGSAISQQDFDQARRNQLQQLQQNSPGGFDPAVLDNPAARSALLESLIDRRVLATTASKERFSVSD